MTQNKKLEDFSFDEADDRIYDIFRHHGLSDYPHAQRKELTKFYFLLMKVQKQENFTRLVKLRDVAIKHFIDSLWVPRLVKLEFPLMDIGTGPGFPGIPLKIHFPDSKIILAEGVQKRVEFLKKVREELELSPLDILGRYIDSTCSFPVQSVITRAVEEISLTLANVSNCLPPGGKVYFMKGPHIQEEVQSAEKNWSHLYKRLKIISYKLPETPHHRNLIIYEKK